MTTAQADSTAPPSFLVKFSFGFGAMATASWAAIGGLLLFFYNQVIGVPAHLVSLALGAILFVDALWDPLIGQISDRTRTSWGRRHPFIYAAALFVPVAFYLRWNPPAGWSHELLFVYILLTGLFVNLSTSLFDVPANALAPELAKDYHGRTVLLGYRWVFLALGTIVTNVLVYGVFLRATPDHPIGQLNPEGYGPLSIAVAGIIVFSVLVLALGTHHRIPSLHKPSDEQLSLSQQLTQVFQTLKNWNFGVAVVASAIAGVGTGLTNGLTLYFNTYLWELTAQQILILTLISVPAAPIAAMIAPVLGRRFGKKRSCMTLFFIGVFLNATPIALKLMGFFPDNDAPFILPYLCINLLVVSILGITGFILVSSMIADIVEDAQVNTGRRSEGLILTADSLPQKLITSLSTVVPGLLLAYVGFPERAQPGEVPFEVMQHLGWIYLPIVLVLSLLSVATWSFFRIDEKTHNSNLAATLAPGPAE